MKSKGKLVIIGGAVNKGSFTETSFDQNVEKILTFLNAESSERLLMNRS
jgi:cyanophycinase